MDDFFDFVFVMIVIISVISTIARVKKAANNGQNNSERPLTAQEELRRKIESAKQAQMHSESTYESHTPQVAPHVAPHVPTVHPMTEETDCEAHQRPVSSEGSPIRAHAYTTTDTACDAHAQPVSTEGETKEQRLARLRKQKEERERQLAFDARYDEQEKRSRREARIRKPEYEKTTLSFTDNAILQGIVYSEILKPPVSKRRYRD